VDISSHNVGIKNFHPDKRSVFKLSLVNLEADPINLFNIYKKKSWKIPKGQVESVNLRRTDNTMAKRKMTNNDLQNTTDKTKGPATRTPLKSEGELMVSSSCSTSDTRRVTLVTKPVINQE
jgi:hypothetical protein